MPYVMLETAEDGIKFISAANFTFKSETTMLRFHAFGSEGDLLVRLDEDHIYWRFVGYKSVYEQLKLNGKPYPNPLKSDNGDEHALLWGAYDKERGHWHENRVGKAPLTYPFPENTDRLEIHTCRVLDAETHEIMAYWTYELAAHQPQQAQES
jgi:hypothetical protein